MNNPTTDTRTQTIAPMRVRRAPDPTLSPGSRACCECGGRFVPGDLDPREYGRESKPDGAIVYTCPGCFEGEGPSEWEIRW